MAAMLAELYDALRSAGADDDKAKRAAAEVAAYDNRLAGMEKELASLSGKVDRIGWMLGSNIALTVLVLGGLLWR